MAEAKIRRINTGAIWSAAGIALVLVFFGVRHLTRERLPVRAAECQVRALVSTISTNGKVEPQLNFAAHAPSPSIVRALYVHAGDNVQRGKLLLELGDADARSKLASAVASLRGAQANYQAVQSGGTQEERMTLSSNIAKAQIERDQASQALAAVQKLQAQGAASPSEVAAAQQRLKLAETTLNSLEQQKTSRYAGIDTEHAQAGLTEARAGYAAAAEVIAQSNVRAPFAGTVYSLPVQQYEYVQPGSELLQLADLTKLQVRAYFDEPEIGQLALGDPIRIVWDAKPGRTWHGKIIRLPSTIITFGTRNVGEVLVSVDDSDGVLLPNTNVTVTVTTQSVGNALTVPREALHIESGRDYVYVINGEILHRRPVQIGALNLTEVQIVSGLKEHEIVALGTTNGALISEGMPVHVVR